METTEVIIARLVLGYLKGEKCKSAYKEFLRTSCTLQGDMTFAKSKYFPTRFVGLTLEDILSEYFEIYKIVQGRLEATNYYNEFHSKTSLVHQLLYLFNKINSSRTSTPCPRSPLESNLDETSPSHLDHISDVETTPAHTLPGNIRCISEDSYLRKSPIRRSQSKLSKSSTFSNLPDINKEDMSEVLAQTLLENREFQEKIAQTINKVAEKQYKVSAELDETIKTVVRETEEDPIFDKILEEIIGSTAINDNNKTIESVSTVNSGNNASENTENRSRKTYNVSNSGLSKYCEQSSKSCLKSQTVEEQNNEAIRSIVANANLGTNVQGNNDLGTNNPNNIAGQGSSEVIVFDGSLDKYLISNTCNATTQTQIVENPLYIKNTGSLLMVPSNITTNVAGNLHVDSSQQYYFVNKQSSMNWSIPAIRTSNLITEQDILAMPTVIVNDGISIQSVIQTPSNRGKNSVTTLLPKPIIEIPSNLGEYLTFHSHKEPQQNGLKNVIYPKKPKPKSTTVNASTSKSTVTLTSTIDLTNENESLPTTELLINPPSNNTNENKPLPTELLIGASSKDSTVKTHEQELNKPQLSKNEHVPNTPPPEQVQKVTPKSASHVRNLDFSTPPKITSTHKKSIKSSQANKTPPFIHKKQAAKALFSPQDGEMIDADLKSKENDTECKIKTRKLTGNWDADLRSAIASDVQIKNQTPKRKRKSPLTKVKRKKNKKIGNNVNPQLNTTEQDAALLEAALQSPVKPYTDNSQIVDGSVKEEIVEDNKFKPNLSTSNREHNKLKPSSSSTKKFPSKKNNIKSKKTVRAKCQETADNNKNKMILSPSKLNASKRNLMNTDIIPSDVANESEDKNKFITPEMIKETVQQPIKASRNITPMLETPIKHERIPKTPGLQTPVNPPVDLNISLSNSVFTPFSKMLEENLKGIDINSLPTPNIPITPNFPPFTPTVDLISPYSNRPTDYSTSSSYYQPSDSEQNRSLEANVKEIEKKPIKVLSNELLVPESGVITKSDVSKNEEENEKNYLAHPTIVSEHLNIFNKNVIGKKNLNLMKRDDSSSSSSSENTSSDSSSEEENNSDSCLWNEKESNDTIIFNKKVTETPRRTYLLRNRTTASKDKEELHKLPIATKEVKVNKAQVTREKKAHPKGASNTIPKQVDKESKTVSKDEKNVPRKVEKDKETSNADIKEDSTKAEQTTTLQQTVLRELEEKRLRIINKFKNLETGSQKKSAGKQAVRQNAKFMKIKPIPNLTNSKRRPRKSDSPKKSLPNRSLKVNDEDLDLKVNDEDLDNLKNDNDKSKIPCGLFEEKSTSDVEAQHLIEGLKERGIHLMHNKSSPNKKLVESPVNSNYKNKNHGQLETTDLIKSTSDDTANISNTTTDINKSFEVHKNELSTSELESELRDTYDTRIFDEYECVVYDESKNITKTFEDYNTKVLEKKFIGKVFIEEINEEIDISISFSPLYTLFDLQPTEDLSSPNDKISQLEKKVSKKESHKTHDVSKEELNLNKDVVHPTISDEISKSDDDLMNYAIVGTLREENPEGSESPNSTRKRKLWNPESSHTEKKCKTLLKQINVDSFLNNIHGGI